MSHRRSGRALTRVLALLAGGGLVAATLTTTPSAQAVPWTSQQTGFKTGNYIVTLTDIPATAYAGTIPGLARTMPERAATSVPLPLPP